MVINWYLNRKCFELMNHLREYIKVLLIGFCYLQKAGFTPKQQPIIKMVSVPNVRVMFMMRENLFCTRKSDVQMV